jgi:hypothetical protein
MKLYDIHDIKTGRLTGALDRTNIIAIYPNSDAFIIAQDGEPYEVVADGTRRGLRKIREIGRRSQTLKRLRRLRA